ncbi:MAG: ChbG/HpnK family deacetylase, partial [Anaerolineae bacterium]
IPLLEGVPSSVVRDILRQDKQLVDAKKVRHPDLYTSKFFGQGVILENLLSILEGLPEGVSELMCHPGFVDEGLTGSTYTWQREREVALLCHPQVKEKVAELGIELVTFSAL